MTADTVYPNINVAEAEGVQVDFKGEASLAIWPDSTRKIEFSTLVEPFVLFAVEMVAVHAPIRSYLCTPFVHFEEDGQSLTSVQKRRHMKAAHCGPQHEDVVARKGVLIDSIAQLVREGQLSRWW